jgi:hypothetical protein
MTSTPVEFPAEWVLATADMGDARIHPALQDLLRLIRVEFDMDVAFLAEFVEGRRVFREIDVSEGFDLFACGDSHALEDSLCQRIVDGRIPRIVQDMRAWRVLHELPDVIAPVGAHAGVPVLRRDGSVYGTLCCLSFGARMALGEVQLQRLEMSAQIAARMLDEADRGVGP